MGAAFNPLIIILPMILLGLVPVAGAATFFMSLVIITSVGLVFFKLFVEVLRHVPFVRHVIPDDMGLMPGPLNEVGEGATRSSAGAESVTEPHVRDEIESDILQIEDELSKAALARRNALTPEIAAERVSRADNAVSSATSALAQATLHVRQHGGGWMQVCRARETLRLANEHLLEVTSDAKAIGACDDANGLGCSEQRSSVQTTEGLLQAESVPPVPGDARAFPRPGLNEPRLGSPHVPTMQRSSFQAQARAPYSSFAAVRPPLLPSRQCGILCSKLLRRLR